MNRRQSLGLLAATLLPAVVNAGAAAATPDLSSPESRFRALMLLRAALDDRLTMEWIKGVIFGVVDSALKPLFSVNSVAFAYYRSQPDGSFRGRRVEVIYHGDLVTGQRLESFLNPYTGATVEVPMERSGPMDAVLTINGLGLPPRLGPMSLQGETVIRPAVVRGPRLWISMETRTRLFPPNATRAVSMYNETMTYAGLLADISGDERRSAPSQLSYSNLMSWRPWLQMGNIAGHTVTNGSGEKVESLQELPEDLRDFVSQQHPDLARDARAVLDAKAGTPAA